MDLPHMPSKPKQEAVFRGSAVGLLVCRIASSVHIGSTIYDILYLDQPFDRTLSLPT